MSVDDIVEAEATEHEGMYRFLRVHTPSGNRTIRVVFEEGRTTSDADAQSLLERILETGSSYEGATSQYLVVTIPGETSLQVVTAMLDSARLRWEYANPTFEELQSSG